METTAAPALSLRDWFTGLVWAGGAYFIVHSDPKWRKLALLTATAAFMTGTHLSKRGSVV